MARKIFVLGLEWDSLAIAQKVSESFKQRSFTDRKGSPIGSSITMGISDDQKETAFIIEGFDLKLMFGLVVQVQNEQQLINIYGGRFNESKSIDTKYHEKFTDLGKASKYLDEALREYDEEIKK